MEHAIGTKITLEVVEVEKGKVCQGCYYENISCCGHKCMDIQRADHKNVIYKEIKQETK